MKVQDIYKWEAEMTDGSLVSDQSPPDVRGDLRDCVRFSLTPSDFTGLPAHDVSGVPMVRRFCRGFHRHRFNRKTDLPGKLFWMDGADVLKTSEDWREVLSPGDFIGKGVDGEAWYEVTRVEAGCVCIRNPYSGKSKPGGMFCRMIKAPTAAPVFVYLHCVVCRQFRVWFNYGTGAVTITGPNEELYM